ncbi:MAG: GntR family transcriptional regulator [Oscillospiraceae bacterium]|nr:GntR family transcriptional regulator [Oscillospiraceae bacterium]MBQ2633744.1 GntR family transcriptional regulator [Oscillospiraceae bacterium]MBR3860397.1 GntR family transcriptional regulator [Oscillospiraceae bacterium]MBR6095628.1 GntR family transcriptional regulator [Oscillospiraceae bacterium]MBR7057010.1 GntR family transcriptional regulator [Oscillospiraceae bacterium]
MSERNPVLLSTLSLDSDIPLYSQLVSIVKRNISAGTLAPGDLLPSEAELCKTFDISRSTVRQAIGALESEGMVVRKQGRGTFVAEPKVRRRTENVYSFTSEISSMGMTPSSTLIEYQVISPTPDIVKMLELSGPDTRVYRFTRIRNVNGEPLILETSFYPQFIYPNLTRELLQTHSFYSLLYEVGIIPANAVDSYEAVMMGPKEAALLNCRSGSCAFSVQRRTFNESGMCYEYTQSLMRADRVKLDVFLHKDGVSFSRSVDKHLE